MRSEPVGLSVILIAKNEARHVVGCLDSVAFADEWIVVESGSTDDTAEIARQWGAQVVSTSDWPGFGPQKNRALDLARGRWVLSIDADERVPVALADEIKGIVANGGNAGYYIPRLSRFCGKPIRHSGWWPDYVLRLFQRERGRFTEVAVHERVEVVGVTDRLQHHFEHDAYDNLEALVTKINRYSSDAAQMMHARGKSTSPMALLGRPIWTFVRIYLIKRGFLDGRHGLILAAAAAAGTFFRYAKLMMLTRDSRR